MEMDRVWLMASSFGAMLGSVIGAVMVWDWRWVLLGLGLFLTGASVEAAIRWHKDNPRMPITEVKDLGYPPTHYERE